MVWAPASFGGDTPGPRVLDQRVAYLVTDILADPLARLPSFGEGSVLELTRPAAVKTGTTTDFRDNWTVGYTPDLVLGVWLGNADNEPMRDISGITGAAPLWHDVMEAALKGRPVLDFVRPEGLVEVEVCALSGLLPDADCPHRVTELFIAGTEPVETCSMHRRIAVDRATGLRATAATPPDQVAERVYTMLPAEAREWGRQQGLPELPPTEVALALQSPSGAASSSPSGGPPLVLSAPDAGAVYRLDPALPRDAQRIAVEAGVSGAALLGEVTLFVDGRPLARLAAPPYRVLWPLEPGEHRFWAEGIDAQGSSVRSNEVHIVVRD